MDARGRGKAIEGALAFLRSQHAQDKAEKFLQRNQEKCLEKVTMLKMIESQSCSCNRSIKNVICRSCGFTFVGRVRTRCAVHPNVIHLMDVDSCPNCRANHLKEFGAVDLHDNSRNA